MVSGLFLLLVMLVSETRSLPLNTDDSSWIRSKGSSLLGVLLQNRYQQVNGTTDVESKQHQQQDSLVTPRPQHVLAEVAIELIIGYIDQHLTKPEITTTSTTTQTSTVDIKTLPGYWLKDPTVLEQPNPQQQTDYRTERYRLDDLLKPLNLTSN